MGHRASRPSSLCSVPPSVQRGHSCKPGFVKGRERQRRPSASVTPFGTEQLATFGVARAGGEIEDSIRNILFIYKDYPESSVSLGIEQQEMTVPLLAVPCLPFPPALCAQKALSLSLCFLSGRVTGTSGCLAFLLLATHCPAFHSPTPTPSLPKQCPANPCPRRFNP